MSEGEIVPQPDLYHSPVKRALSKDGWTIQDIVTEHEIDLLIFDPLQEVIVQWRK